MRTRYATSLLILAVMLLAIALVSAGAGAYPIAPWRIPSILVRGGEGYDVLMAIRFPRILLAALVGAALALSGASLQGLFRNPLAEPGLIGVTSGASLGAASWIVFFSQHIASPLGLPAAAFIGALGAVGVIWLVANGVGTMTTVTLILAGIAMNSLVFAGIGLLTFLSSDEQLRNITFWMLGGLGGATWRALAASFPFMVLGYWMLHRLGGSLNALSLGESEAFHIGVSPRAVRRRVIVGAALLVGAAVSVAGGIGFIGLVIPHLLRLWIGADHRWLLPASMLGGAFLLVLADLAARTVVAPVELPVGIVTALLGGPFFLWLLVRQRKAVLYGA